MAVSGLQRHGKSGRVRIIIGAGYNLVLQNWTVTEHIEDADASNFEGGGYEEHIGGLLGCDVSFSGNWNASLLPWTNPPNIGPGTFPHIQLYPNLADNVPYDFPSFFVVSIQTTVDVHQAVKISITGKSDGVYTPP